MKSNKLLTIPCYLFGLIGIIDTIIVMGLGGGINLGTILPALIGIGLIMWVHWGHRLNKQFKDKVPKLYRVFQGVFLIFISSFLIIEGLIIYTSKSGFSDSEIKGVDYVIILGAGLRGEELSWTLRERVDKGLELLNSHPNMKVVVSGGQGPGENISEAEAMARYLQSQGISLDRILKEEKSTSTMENFQYSLQILQQQKGFDITEPIIIITSDFHLLRSKMLAKRNGLNSVGVPCYTPWYIRPNVYLREYFAMIKSLVLDW